MIDGLKLDVSADEIVSLLDRRIAEHHAKAEADAGHAERLKGTDREDDEGEDEYLAYGEPTADRLRRRAQRERDRKDALTFMRNHVVRGETYRLSTEDLRVIEILQGRYW